MQAPKPPGAGEGRGGARGCGGAGLSAPTGRAPRARLGTPERTRVHTQTRVLALTHTHGHAGGHTRVCTQAGTCIPAWALPCAHALCPRVQAHTHTRINADTRRHTHPRTSHTHARHHAGSLRHQGTNSENCRVFPNSSPETQVAAAQSPQPPCLSLSPSLAPRSPGPDHQPSCHGNTGSFLPPPNPRTAQASRPSPAESTRMREEGVCPPALGPKERGLEIRSDLGSARGRGSDRLPALAGHPGLGAELGNLTV